MRFICTNFNQLIASPTRSSGSFRDGICAPDFIQDSVHPRPHPLPRTAPGEPKTKQVEFFCEYLRVPVLFLPSGRGLMKG